MITELFHPSLYALNLAMMPVLMTGTAILMLGLIVLLAERPSITSTMFFVMTLPLAVWLLSFSGVYAAQDEQTILFWVKAAYLGVPYIPVALYHFTLTVLQAHSKHRNVLALGWGGATLFVALALFTDLLVDGGFYYYPWGHYPTYGALGVPFIIFFFTYMILMFLELWNTYRHAPRPSALYSRARTLLIALGVAYLGAVDFLPKYGVPLYPFGYLPLFLYVILSARIVWRHRLAGMERASIHLASIIEASQDALIEWNLEGTITDWNQGAEHLYGYPAREAIGQPITLIVPLPLHTECLSMLETIRRGEEVIVCDTVHRRKDGSRVDVWVAILPMLDGAGCPLGGSLISRNITYQKVLETVKKNEALQRQIVQTAMDGFISTDAEGTIVEWNPQVEKTFGFSREAVLGRLLKESIATASFWSDYTHGIQTFLATGKSRFLNTQMEVPMRHRDGHLLPVEILIAPLPVGSSWVFNAFIHDISIRKRAEYKIHSLNEALTARTEELTAINKSLEATTQDLRLANNDLERLSITDALTELLNRRGLDAALRQERNRERRSGAPCSVLMIDVDDFKTINDRYGFVIGDTALTEIARQIKGSLRATDVAGRIGGDEFLLFLPATNLAEGRYLGEKICRLLQNKIIMSSQTNVAVTASIAVTTVSEDISSLEELLCRMYSLLQRGKGRGKNQVTTSELAEEPPAPLPADVLLSILDRPQAIQTLFQPIVSLKTMQPIGFELLSRLQAAHLEMPDDFFPISLKAGLLTAVDHACFKNGLQASLALDLGFQRHFNLFPSTVLNISSAQIIQEVHENKYHGVTCIEISEQQVLGDTSLLIEPIQALKKAGILVAVDDVGFGRSSLERLILFQPDIIKVDKVFVKGVSRYNAGFRSFKQLVRIVEVIGATTIAEGVEDPEDLEALKVLGVPYAQGFLFGKPGPVSGFQRPTTQTEKIQLRAV